MRSYKWTGDRLEEVEWVADFGEELRLPDAASSRVGDTDFQTHPNLAKDVYKRHEVKVGGASLAIYVLAGQPITAAMLNACERRLSFK